ncbi:MAG: DsbA family oxidoreductase [Candidatus Saccharimonadales bacterium]
MATTVHIRDFTDPTCPFSYSLEPTRWRLRWLYGDQLSWQSSMIVLYTTIDPTITPEMLATTRSKLRKFYGMPINDEPAARLSTTIDACRAYIAVRLNAPEQADSVLRKLRIAVMSGKLPDEPSVITDVVTSVGINLEHYTDWLEQAGVEALLRTDMREAREPSAVALTLRHKLGVTPEGTKRYSSGSYRFSIDGETVFELPGFWPTATYEAAIANIAPELQRKDDTSNVRDVLKWAGEPLATAEVASIMNKPIEDIRSELQNIATMESVGQDGFWSLNPPPEDN